MKVTVRKTPLYKPAVYAKLLNRPDISLFLTFQNDIEMHEMSMSLSEHLTCHIGCHVENLNAYIGIPTNLWRAFRRINWQSFELDSERNALVLHFHVDIEHVESAELSYGQIENKSLAVHSLNVRLPIHLVLLAKLSQCTILHLCSMDEHCEKSNDSSDQITITKVMYV